MFKVTHEISNVSLVQAKEEKEATRLPVNLYADREEAGDISAPRADITTE
jgi:hypothetical protein